LAAQFAYPGSTNQIIIDEYGSGGVLIDSYSAAILAGNVRTRLAGDSATIEVERARDAVILATAFSAGYGGAYSTSEVYVLGFGSVTLGTAVGYSAGTARMRNYAAGGVMMGYAASFNEGEAVIEINYTGYGALVGGNSQLGYGGVGGSCAIRGQAQGQFVFGNVYVYQANVPNAGLLQGGNGGRGQFIQGNVYVGSVDGYGHILGGTNARGAFAQGNVSSVGSYTGQILASASGAFAQGTVSSNASDASIQATALGAFAHGSATDTDIIASAVNAAQFGPGTNALADSLKVGNAGLRLKGTTGAPAAPQNGDIWVESGYVVIRSNGVTVPIV
jgi:hypothetical protein